MVLTCPSPETHKEVKTHSTGCLIPQTYQNIPVSWSPRVTELIELPSPRDCEKVAASAGPCVSLGVCVCVCVCGCVCVCVGAREHGFSCQNCTVHALLKRPWMNKPRPVPPSSA